MSGLGYTCSGVIDAPPEVVFDLCSDLRNELRWNERARQIEKLTDGPVGVGTRFRARWAGAPAVAVEVVRFDRPRSWVSISKAVGLRVRTEGSLAPEGAASRFTARIDVEPTGIGHLFARAAVRAMEREDRGNMEAIKAAAEAAAAQPTSRSSMSS